MATIEDFVEHTLILSDAAPQEPNFGALRILGYSPTANAGLHTINATPAGLRAYVDDIGGAETDMVKKMLNAIVAQPVHVPEVQFYNTGIEPTILYTLTPLGPFTPGKKFFGVINQVEVEYVCEAGDDAADVATGFVAAAGSIVGATLTDTTGDFTIAASSASYTSVFLQRFSPKQWGIVTGNTNDGDLSDAADLSVGINEELGFYGLLVDVEDATAIADLAPWVETNKKIAIFRTKASNVLTGSGVLDTLFQAGYHRSAIFFSEDDIGRADAALMGRQLQLAPGASDFQFKQLSGVFASVMTDSQSNALKAKNGNSFQSVRGVRFSQNGLAASGRPLALTRNIDWFESRMLTETLRVFLDNEIVLVSNTGIGLFEKAIRAVMNEAQTAQVILPGWTVRAPRLGDISQANKLAGFLSGFSYEAVAGRAARRVGITGRFN